MPASRSSTPSSVRRAGEGSSSSPNCRSRSRRSSTGRSLATSGGSSRRRRNLRDARAGRGLPPGHRRRRLHPDNGPGWRYRVGLMTGVRDYPIGILKHNVVALAKAAKALKVPIAVTTTARDSMWGPTFPELVEALPGIEIIDRSSVNAFDDARVAPAIEPTRRRKLIFAGVSPERVGPLPGIEIIPRSSVTASDDARVAHAIEATRRRKLIFAGVSLEVCAA